MKRILPIFPLLFLAGCPRPDNQTKADTTSTPPVATKASAKISKPRPVEKPSPDDVHRSRSRDARFEATGTLLREPNFHGSVEVHDLKTNRTLAAWHNPGGVTALSFSPDASLLAVNSPEQLTVWKWKTKQRVYARTFDTGGGQYRIQSAFSPDGKQLAVTFGNLMVLSVASWKAQRFPQLGDPAFVDDAKWSPNGHFLALSQHDLGAFSLVEPRSGRVGALKGIDAISDPIFSADSRYLAGASASAGTFIWKVQTAASVSLGGDYDHPLIPIAFSKDARFLACRDEKARVALWRTRDAKQIIPFQSKPATPQSLFERAQKMGRF